MHAQDFVVNDELLLHILKRLYPIVLPTDRSPPHRARHAHFSAGIIFLSVVCTVCGGGLQIPNFCVNFMTKSENLRDPCEVKEFFK